MGSLPYLFIFTLQVVALACNIIFIMNTSYARLMYVSVTAYFLSLFIMVFAIVRGSKGSSLNCMTMLFLLVNLLLYITILFTNYLGDFLKEMKG